MRKVVFIGFVVTGALVGLLSAANDDVATRVVMALVGVLFGVAIGAGLAFTGRRSTPTPDDDHRIPGMGSSMADLAANYSRDKGHPPLMKPPNAAPDHHMFDPDKLG